MSGAFVLQGSVYTQAVSPIYRNAAPASPATFSAIQPVTSKVPRYVAPLFLRLSPLILFSRPKATAALRADFALGFYLFTFILCTRVSTVQGPRASLLLYNSVRVVPIFNAAHLFERETTERARRAKSIGRVYVSVMRDKYVLPRLRFHESRPRSWRVSFIRYAQTTV